MLLCCQQYARQRFFAHELRDKNCLLNMSYSSGFTANIFQFMVAIIFSLLKRDEVSLHVDI
ncbi:MAG TPA: hypothetical protein DCM07_29860 [Planctomycetaceae bacterium]|nr:hypothetical protein [Gimesia sp.]HAH48973.1 hypothetical protein [Planctomycetaceae bacterium]HBL46746.1 hypothetical protein [Planctomycetaceae bacterium]